MELGLHASKFEKFYWTVDAVCLRTCKQLRLTGTRLLYENGLFHLSGGGGAPRHLRSQTPLETSRLESKAIRACYPPNSNKLNGVVSHIKYYDAGEQVPHPSCQYQNHVFIYLLQARGVRQ